jgi:hypothetical protein
MKKALSAFLLSTALAGMLFFVSLGSDLAQASSPVNGIIKQDTTWSKAGSPYVFTGAVGVADGVTLTIEEGVNVRIGSHYLEVNGTLNAEGTSDELIYFSSNSQIQAAPSDCLNTYPSVYNNPNILLVYGNPVCNLEYVVLDQSSFQAQSYISNATLTLDHCSLLGGSSVNLWGTTTISDSYVNGSVQVRGDSTITGNILLGGLDIAGSCSGSRFIGTYSVSGNNITNQPNKIVLNAGASGTVIDNVIWGGSIGICQGDGFPTMSVDIRNNLITDNQIGIYTRTQRDDSKIFGNSILGNKIGISNPSSQQTITGNNFENSQYNIQAGLSAVSAANNWWETTDRDTIDQKIYDSNDDFNLGTIVYTPFSTSANSNAPESPQDMMILTTAPLPTEGVTFQTVSHANSESLSSLEIGVGTAVVIVAALVATIAIRTHRKRV